MPQWAVIKLGIFAALIVVAFGTGWVKGRDALQARLDAHTMQAQAAALETTKALAVAEQARRTLSQALEDQANADPVAVPVCLSAVRVSRLNAIH